MPGANTRLARGVLSSMDAIAVSVTVLAPGMAMLLNVPGVAAVAGGSTPLAFQLGGLACLALAYVVVGFARRMASAGYAYTYASRSLGTSAGFMAGWLYAFGLICFVPMTMAAVASLACDLLHVPPHWWFLFFLAGTLLLAVVSAARVRVATRLQLAVGIATVAVIVVVDTVVVAKGGAGGNTLAPFTFDHTQRSGVSGIFYGIILGVTSYIGFETAADFGEETSRPRRSVPVAVIVSVVFAIVFYLWTTYSLSIGFGVNNGAAFGGDPFALKTIADRYVGAPFGTLVEVGALLSAFFVCVGCSAAGSRTLYAMGREGVLPRWLGATHSRYRTPVNAALTVAAVSVVLAAVVGFAFASKALGGPPDTVYFFFATLGTLAVIVVYMGLCVGGAVFFRRTQRPYNVLPHLAVPAIGVLLFGAALYGSVRPVPAHPLNLTPYVALGWLVLGIVAVAVLRARRPDAVGRIGSMLGEEDPLVASTPDNTTGPPDPKHGRPSP
ncbi:APC family permease [Streptantibioticus silvisoli]|uniref:APC family permease n=1 Tax=Streptantibioticus silvisoli TaxID=2705255 RepID=A0ABT6VSU8_9ACTN|nr:APC family permease [Streptantibioticus silvisoli]MDI5961255.1 APC family permease [Streptantibioticus silvisoli]